MAKDANLSKSEYEANIQRGLDVIKSMIDISAERLESLRTQCATSAELTQQEIRTLEAKLVKMFSELLITKAKLPEQLRTTSQDTKVELKQWLRVVGEFYFENFPLQLVHLYSFGWKFHRNMFYFRFSFQGLSPDSLNIVMSKMNSLETLIGKNDADLRVLMTNNTGIREEEVRRLLRAVGNLQRCQAALSNGGDPQELYWDSWDRHHHIHHRTGASPRPHRSAARHQQQHQRTNPAATTNDNANHDTSVVDDGSSSEKQLISPEETSVSTITPSPSPPNSPSVTSQPKKKSIFATTPPAKKKLQTLFTLNQQMQQQTDGASGTAQTNIQNNNDQIVLPSKHHHNDTSHSASDQESVTTPPSAGATSNANSTTAFATTPRSRIHTEPSPEGYNDIVESTNNLTVPRSPCTPIVTRGMGHQIAHRFTKKFKVISTCDLCNKQMFFGLKCKECKYRCHKDCESNVPPSCGLPPEFINEFKKSLPSDVFLPNSSPNMGGKSTNYLLSTGRRDRIRSQAFVQQYTTGPDSSSAGSSCNSSSPSSPALLQMPPPQTPAASKHTQFHFPDLNSSGGAQGESNGITLETIPIKATDKAPAMRPLSPRIITSDLSDTHRSNDSDKTVSLSGSTSASTDSDRTPVRLDSMEERDSGNWPRQNSLSLKEWDIPFSDLNLLEPIGRGRFGTVHRGLWHGDVAVKLLKEDYVDDERTLEAFKLEVATFKKTRHENLVLFMGACMKPQAIVTSLCKGNTLYTHIHLRKDKFNLSRTTLVAQQISQGMGYLHAREIVHKDLKTKNIFLENGKVIITDFGLFSATKLQYYDQGMAIPSGWLSYLAPELIRGLKPIRPAEEELLFSKASDVYAFGTVWYELLCGEFPFKRQPPEAIIFQVGRGMKQTLANLQASRDVKDILMLCWAFQADDRPDFAKLLTLLERLPKKRLARSPSHPVQLSRSAESVF